MQKYKEDFLLNIICIVFSFQLILEEVPTISGFLARVDRYIQRNLCYGYI